MYLCFILPTEQFLQLNMGYEALQDNLDAYVEAISKHRSPSLGMKFYISNINNIVISLNINWISLNFLMLCEFYAGFDKSNSVGLYTPTDPNHPKPT